MIRGPELVSSSRIVEQPRSEWPAPLRGDRPINLHSASMPPRVDAGTTAANARNPVAKSNIGARPTPLATGISPHVARELDKMGSEIAGRVRNFLIRKG